MSNKSYLRFSKNHTSFHFCEFFPISTFFHIGNYLKVCIIVSDFSSLFSNFKTFLSVLHNSMSEFCSANYESYQTDCFDTSYKSALRVWLF